MLQKLSVSDK